MSRIEEYIFNKFPSRMTVSSPGKLKNIDRIGRKITSPQNRLIMGVTALASQPFIDLYNDKVDNKTRVMSCAKTLAKIIVGTSVGVIVRHSAIAFAKKGCRIPDLSKKMGKWASVFVPENVDLQKEADNILTNHKNTIGTVIGTAAGLVTNFVIDMPLTKYLTNVFIHKFAKGTQTQDTKGENK